MFAVIKRDYSPMFAVIKRLFADIRDCSRE